MNGRWSGTFFYPDEQEPVGFVVSLEEKEGRLSGRIKEPNSFSMELVACLVADVEGSLGPEGQVAFTKRYDGAGASHAVDYTGCISADGRSLFGAWSIDAYSGPFVIHLDRPAGELPLIAHRPRRRLGGEWTGQFAVGDTTDTLRVSLVHGETTVEGKVTLSDGEPVQLTGDVMNQAMRFEAGRGQQAMRFVGWLGPNGRSLGGGCGLGPESGVWVVVKNL